MNTVYKVIFNKSTGQWVAVSELARGITKSTSNIIKQLMMLSVLALGLTLTAAPAVAESCTTSAGRITCIQTYADEDLSYDYSSSTDSIYINAVHLGAGKADLKVTNSSILGVSSGNGLYLQGQGASLVLSGTNKITLDNPAADTAILVLSNGGDLSGDGSAEIYGQLDITIDRLGANNSDGIEVSGKNATLTHRGGGTITTNGGKGIFMKAREGIAKIILDGDIGIIVSGKDHYGMQATSATGNIDITTNATIQTDGENGHGIYAVVGTNGGAIEIANTGTIITEGDQAHGIFAAAGADTGKINITNAKKTITVSGTDAHAIRAISRGGMGDITINHQKGATITSKGNHLDLIDTTRNDAINGFGDAAMVGNITINVDGNVETNGANRSAGVYAQHAGTGNATVNGSGNITAKGPSNAPNEIYSYGLAATLQGPTAAGDATVNYSPSAASNKVVTQGDQGFALYAGVSGLSGNASVVNHGTLETFGKGAHGIWSRSETTALASATSGNATVENYGAITTKGAQAHAIYTNTTKGNIEITNTGLITTENLGARGIYAFSSGTGSITIENSGSIRTSNVAVGPGANSSQALYANISNSGATSGGIKINQTGGFLITENFDATGIRVSSNAVSGNIDIDVRDTIIDVNGENADGIFVSTSATNAYIDVNVTTNNGTIDTLKNATQNGTTNYGIVVQQQGANATGNINIINNGTTINTGLGGNGLAAYSSALSATFSKADSTGNIKIKNLGLLSTKGVGASAISANNMGSGTVMVQNNAKVTALGVGAHGVYTSATTGISEVSLDSASDIQGGSGTAAGVSMISTTGNQTLTNAGKIGALSDLALYSEATGGSFTATNTGTVTGFMKLTGDTVTINNQAGGIVSLKNFGLGIKDTIDSQFGGNGLFNNAGRLELNSLNYDGSATNATLSGIKIFDHSGVISLSSVESGRGIAYAGDTLGISGDFVSNNGSLFIDTLLNNASTNGGIGSSDRLLLQNTVLGSGATKVYVTPMTGSSGGVTLNNGIEVVNVSGTSAAGAFVLGHDVFSGAYEYQLTQTGNNWYLANTTGLTIQPPVSGLPGGSEWNPWAPWIPDGSGGFVPNPWVPDFTGGLMPNPWWPQAPMDPNLPWAPWMPTGPNGNLIGGNGIGYQGQTLYRPDAGIELSNRESVIDMMVPGLSGTGAAPNGIGGSGAMRAYTRLGGGNDGGENSGTVQGQKSNSLWTFATMNNNRGKAAGGQIRYHGKSKGLQIGGDRIFAVGDGLIQAGIMTHMTNTDTKSRNLITGSTARGASDGYGFGVYATWYAKANDVLSPFVDTYALYGRFKNTVKTRNNSDYSYRSNAFSFTMIGGYPLALGNSVIIEPQAQLTYVKYGSQNHQDHANTDVTLKTKGNLVGRVGAYVYGHGYRVQPYGAFNVWYDDTRTEMRYNIDGGKVGAEKRGTIFEAKLGFQTQATKNLTVWGEVSGRMGQNSYRDVGGAIGLKYSW